MSRTDLAVVSGLLTAVCVIPYLRDVYRGTTRPQRVSWLVFAILSIVAAVSQFLDGAYAGAWLTSGAALGFTLVFLASIRRGVGGMSRSEVLSLLVAISGLGISLAVQEPFIAVLAVVVAEIPAVSLTVRKALRDPASETASTWLIDGLAGVCALLAVSELSLSQVLYPLHHIIANSCVLIAILLRRLPVLGVAGGLGVPLLGMSRRRKPALSSPAPKAFRRALRAEGFAWHQWNARWTVTRTSLPHREMQRVARYLAGRQ